MFLHAFSQAVQLALLQCAEHKPHEPTSEEAVKQCIANAVASGAAWRQLSNAEKADLMRESLELLVRNMHDFARDGVKVKGSHGSGLGEELSVAVPAAMCLDDYEKALRANGQPAAVAQRTRADRVICDVWPQGSDNILFGGASAEVWIKPGCPPSQGRLYREGLVHEQLPGVAGVLAAGNYMCVALRDTLHQLVAHNNLVVIKMNPVNDWAGAHLECILEPFISRGFVQVVYGGAAVAQMLVQDERVTHMHMTGAGTTYNAIVWGSSAPGQGPRLCSKPFTAELGCVTPFIVVPSVTPWSAAELEAQAAQAVASVWINSGHSCNSTEVIVTAKGWPQREAFLAAVRQLLDRHEQRFCWYPGSQEKQDKFRERFPAAEELGVGACSMTGCTSPTLLVTGLDRTEVAGQDETWSPCLQEVALETATFGGAIDVEDFLAQAVSFVNDDLFGTLSCALAVHPSTAARHKSAVQQAVEDLRYGNVCVNVSPSVGFTVTSVPWGAWSAAGTAEDIGSGNVLAHSMLYDHAEKAVLWFPITLTPRPPWHIAHTNQAAVAARLIQYIAARGPLSLALLLKASFGSQ